LLARKPNAIKLIYAHIKRTGATMPIDSRSRLIECLLEALSLAEHYEEQTPPSPITLAALNHSLQDLIAEIEEITVVSRLQEVTN